MSDHRLDAQPRRDAAAFAAVADALDRLRQPRCLRPSRFWQLAAGEECKPDELRHLLGCGRCRTYTGQVAAALEGGPEPPSWASLNARVRVAAVRCRVAQQGLSKAGPQRLTFSNDAHLCAVCTTDPTGGRRLDVEHRLLPPGVPLVLLLDSRGSAEPWRRFVLLREGSHGAEACVRVETTEDGMVLRVGRLDLEDLAGLAEPAPLRASYEAAARDDPAALPHWQVWAREAFTQTGLSAAIGSLLEEIARGRLRASASSLSPARGQGLV
jgi:hypothetical protein